MAGPCDLTEPAEVARVFRGAFRTEQPGNARNCRYQVAGGKDQMRGPAAQAVDVYYYGDAAGWDGQVAAMKSAGIGPVREVRGIGEKAVRHPGDKDNIVVLAGDTVFAVGVTSPLMSEFPGQTEALARKIAATLG